MPHTGRHNLELTDWEVEYLEALLRLAVEQGGKMVTLVGLPHLNIAADLLAKLRVAE
jgi:hypothetical protein